jgi:MFS transporter, DHA1 family, inner membrane transport protein
LTFSRPTGKSQLTSVPQDVRMAYLRNGTINLLNLHYGIHALAMNSGGTFFVVFLLKSGVTTPAVLAAIAFILGGRFLIRPLVLVLARRWGLRPLVALGTVLSALQFPLLAEVQGVGPMLLATCVVASIGDTLYWTTYHAYFASLGDAEHRGHQISAREALASLAGIIGPLLGGWALATLGPRVAFGVVSVVQILSALPFIGTPGVAVAATVPGAYRAALRGVLLFAADGWIAVGHVFIWPIALFLSLGESFTAFGGALALAALVGAVAGLLLGRHIDAGHGGRAAWLACGGLAVLTVVRALSTQNAVLAVAANALGAVVMCLYIPTLMTAVYNQAKRAPCTLRFHIATEGGWDFGGAVGCLVAALLIAAGLPLAVGILLSFGGIAASFVLLRGYYDLPLTEPAP